MGAGLYDVQLVAAARPVLDRPKHAGRGVDRRRLDVAIAIGSDLRQGAILADEGIVLGHAAIGVDAHDLAEMGIQLLGLAPEFLLGTFAHGDVDVGLSMQSRSEEATSELQTTRSHTYAVCCF